MPPPNRLLPDGAGWGRPRDSPGRLIRTPYPVPTYLSATLYEILSTTQSRICRRVAALSKTPVVQPLVLAPHPTPANIQMVPKLLSE